MVQGLSPEPDDRRQLRRAIIAAILSLISTAMLADYTKRDISQE